MALLGDDGRGYELARKLETHGVWRPWLGDSLYFTFIHFLSSPSNWEAFMRSDDSTTRPQIHLQLRVRALLFDKASDFQFLHSAALSNLNPNYLELHGDDVYFTLENDTQDGDERQTGSAGTNTAPSKGHSKTSMNVGSRFREPDADAVAQRFKSEDFPETWYSQFFEKYKANKSYKPMSVDKDSEKQRTPEQMSTYLRVIGNHKRRRATFKDNASNMPSNPLSGESSGSDDILFFPETMFNYNCVPDSAVLKTSRQEINQKVQFNGVLDNLPVVMIKSPPINPIMIERLGIRPEYLNMEQGLRGRSVYQRNRKLLSQDQASQMSQKVVARLLTNVGFDSSSDTSLEVMAQFFSCHIHKLGCILKLLADSYRQQCSATELIKMFLKTARYGNLGVLAEFIKDNTKNVMPQTQQQVLNMQAQLQSQLQTSLQQQHAQQLLRQINPQMQQHINSPQYLAFQQQQWEKLQLRRRQQQQQQQQQPQQQQVTPRPGMNMSMNLNMDKDRPLVQVKMENTSDFPMDTSAFAAMNSRNPHLQQYRQHQLAAMSSSLHAQANNNSFRPMASLQVPQIQSPNMVMGRTPSVKVEGFQELMGGDSSAKHDSEENKLISPQK